MTSRPGSPWACWRHFILRGAGFAADQVRALSDPAAAAAADAVLAAEADLERAIAGARQTLQADLDAICRRGAGKDDPRFRPLLAALRSLRRGKLRKAVMAALSTAAAASLAGRRADLETARHESLRAYEEALTRQSRKLGAVASSRRFREAVLWQNHEVYHSALEKVARRPRGARNRRRRRHEELVAKYLQRYTVKNDSIGFFGPVVWGSIGERHEPLRVRPGKTLLARREVFLEAWCVDELATRLTADFDVRRFFAPRWRPIARLHDGRLHLPTQPPIELPAAQVRILERVDGRATAGEIAADARAEHDVREDDVFELLASFAGRGLLHWGFQVSFEPAAAADLGRQIEALPDRAARRVCRRALERLEAARRKVAQAAGRPRRLDRRLAELDETFTGLTGRTATRQGGEFYTGRTLAYEECERDLEIEVGDELHRAIVEPLSIVLRAARWYTWRTEREARSYAAELYRQLARESGSPRVAGVVYLQGILGSFNGDAELFMRPVHRDLEERWQRLLPETPGDRRLRFNAAELRDRARELFDAPHAGWQKGRYCNPDLMIASPSVAAVCAGNYRIVLGEIHVSRNVYNRRWPVKIHPDPDGMLRALEQDLPETRLLPLMAKNEPNLTTRLQPYHFSPNDFVLATGTPAAKKVDRSRLTSIADLWVEDSPSGLVLRSRDGRLCLDLIEAIGDFMTGVSSNTFRIGPVRTGHGPRVSVDRLVLRRESWSWRAEDLTFATEKDPARRFLEARRLARAHRLPQHVFYRTPAEPKPMLADFASPIYVDVLAKTIRKTRELDGGDHDVVMTEMLPSFDELWLPDAEGRRYTAELRMMFLDLAQRPRTAAVRRFGADPTS